MIFMHPHRFAAIEGNDRASTLQARGLKEASEDAVCLGATGRTYSTTDFPSYHRWAHSAFGSIVLRGDLWTLHECEQLTEEPFYPLGKHTLRSIVCFQLRLRQRQEFGLEELPLIAPLIIGVVNFHALLRPMISHDTILYNPCCLQSVGGDKFTVMGVALTHRDGRLTLRWQLVPRMPVSRRLHVFSVNHWKLCYRFGSERLAGYCSSRRTVIGQALQRKATRLGRQGKSSPRQVVRPRQQLCWALSAQPDARSNGSYCFCVQSNNHPASVLN